MTNYRICFDYSANSPREALSHYLSLVTEPMRDVKFDWHITDLSTGERHVVNASTEDLNREAAEFLKRAIAKLKDGSAASET